MEPQTSWQIYLHFEMQTLDPMKHETVEKQLVDVLKTSTQSGVIQRKNEYYCASTYVEDVKRILMDDSKWFTPSASPSDISLGPRSQISVGSQMSVSSAVSIKEAESSVNSVVSTSSTLSNCSGMSAEATMLSTTQDDDKKFGYPNCFADTTATVAAAPSPSPAASVPVPFPSNYQHDFQRKQQQQPQSYNAPAYLPPTGHQQQQTQLSQQSYQAAGYLPPITSSSSASSSSSGAVTQALSVFQAPDYLPPQQSQQQQQQQKQQVYQGPTYLPPSTSSSSTTSSSSSIASSSSTSATAVGSASTQYSAPGYLPPGYEFNNPEANQITRLQPVQQQSIQQQPIQQQSIQQQPIQQQQLQPTTPAQATVTATATATSYQAPGYLPPGYDFANPDVLPISLTQQQSVAPVQHIAPVQAVAPVQHVAPVQQPAIGEYRAPDYLPPSYESPKLLQQPQPIVYQQPQQSLPVAQPTQATISHPGVLPDGYDNSYNTSNRLCCNPNCKCPINNKEPILSMANRNNINNHWPHKQLQRQQQQPHQPPHLQLVHTKLKVICHQWLLGQQHHCQLLVHPRQPQQQQRLKALIKHKRQQYNAPGYLPPTSVPVAAQAPPTTQVTHIHSLSSYMNTVQPFARYAQPVQQHQHQQHRIQYQQRPQQQQQHQQVIEVAPMYREQSKRPRFYAPAMSYVRTALPQQYRPSQPQRHVQHQHQHHHYQQQQQQQQQRVITQKLQPVSTTNSLSLQAQQSLQKFMPKDIQMAVNVAVAAATPTVRAIGSSKVRTVQIVKPHAVRTFKVLESLDQNGVKTIKILGASNEVPQGHHHVVKVVTQNAQSGVESHVQTVKIYDDQQEYVPQQQQQQTIIQRGYLPPQQAQARPRTRIVRQVQAKTLTKPLRLLPVASSSFSSV
ncbi:uncharacterized protein Dwil_GK14871 [Drosophila willistoni]|uniref:Uncharacterized protein n=1 Tax=Drosophila willistoni TaxID=7260 RepID=B4NPM0_DROWI|nr:uncharacterized protein Dwil_GK14871 [Drosophila willistoni]